MSDELAAKQCACPVDDRYWCWAHRYGVQVHEVEEDGGPCECPCHEEEDDER